MSKEVKVPTLPESVADATVAKWHKKAGERVRRDENLVDLETDKVMLEVPAPTDGVLGEIKAEEGETVNADQVLGVIDTGEEKAGEKDDEENKKEQTKDKEEQKEKDKGKKAKKTGKKAEAKEKAEEEPEAEPEEKRETTAGDRETAGEAPDTSDLAPSVRRLVAENRLDPGQIPATGRGGRITKGDVIEFLKSGAPAGPRPEERVKMSRLRKRIAERMKEAQNTAAILTSFNEVNLQAVVDLRKRYKEEFQETFGVKLGFMSFFVKACCEALQKFPVVNASVDGEEIVYHGYQDIGIAVSTERGLLVPVIRDAHRLSLAEIETQIAEYAEQARTGKIKLEDLQGGTFSITNGGVFGSLLSTPLLNPPQSAILGMHAIKERPMAEHGEIVVRPMMYIALSYDHRIIDGREAVLFLVAVKEALEDPARMLIGL